MNNVAVVGGGPAGLVAARYLKQHGFEPTVFEQSGGLGGQWQGGAGHSGVWPAMRTNTSRIMTAFSDLPYPDDVAVYPRNQEVLAYLQRYATQAGLDERLRTRQRVVEIDRAGERAWRVSALAVDGSVRSEIFDKVVVASGRYNKPSMPDLDGLGSFDGPGGVSHTFHYRGAARFDGMRVMVAGGSISALEIASELAMCGVQVVSSQRKQRYVLQKLVAGVPVDHLAFTRFAALAAESLPLTAVAGGLKEFIVRNCGSPEQFGAIKPADSVLEAGITQSQNFLPMVAEGRITTKPWIRSIDRRRVVFVDGSETEVDAIIFGTGFHLHLPFLSPAVRETVCADLSHLDLYADTLHPSLQGLAFMGLYDIVGPAFPVLELQARWLAYLWSGIRPEPGAAELQAGLDAARAARQAPPGVPMHVLAVRFARLAGAEPDPSQFPQLAPALLFGPLAPVSFRLDGPDALPDAVDRTRMTAAAFGALPGPEMSGEQREQLQALARARQDPRLARLADLQ